MELDLEHPLPAATSSNHNNSKHLNFHHSLFHIESQHMPINNNNLINFSIRRETISIILGLSHKFDPLLSYLAINYLHRFLPSQPILLQGAHEKPWLLKLLAVSCVSLALKMRKSEHPVAHIMQPDDEVGFIFDKQTIWRMELLILGALKWRMRSITPFSFMDFFVSLFAFKDPPLTQALKARATQILFKSQIELRILEFKPSIVAASALLSASHELFPLQFRCFKKAISACSYVNKASFVECNNVMREIAMDEYESVLDKVWRTNTPVNVLDRQWGSSSSDDSINGDTKNGTIRGVESIDFKRRKIHSCD